MGNFPSPSPIVLPTPSAAEGGWPKSEKEVYLCILSIEGAPRLVMFETWVFRYCALVESLEPMGAGVVFATMLSQHV